MNNNTKKDLRKRLRFWGHQPSPLTKEQDHLYVGGCRRCPLVVHIIDDPIWGAVQENFSLTGRPPLTSIPQCAGKRA